MFIRFFLSLILAVFSFSYGYSEDSDLLVLDENEVFTGNFFALKSSVEIAGLVKGDVYIAAAQCSIDGVIEGDLLLACASADVTGHVKGNVRALTGQINISGTVDKNITIVGGNVELSPSGVVYGSVVAVGGNTDISGSVFSDVTIACSHAKIAGQINRNVDGYVNEFRITSKARILGDVVYKSSNQAIIDPRAKIGGVVRYHQPVLSNIIEWSWLKGFILGSKILVVMMNFAFTFVFGLIVIKLFPSQVLQTSKVLNEKLMNSLGVGVVILVLAPLLSILLLITVIGAPFALALIALNIFSFYTAKIFFVVWMTARLFPKLVKKKGKLITFTLGLFLYYLCTMIPYLGTLLAFVSMLLGVGAVVLVQSGKNMPLIQNK
jgi:hypothetical protein